MLKCYFFLKKAVLKENGSGCFLSGQSFFRIAIARPGYSYRNQWWITHNRFNAYEANGLYGQRIHIAPLAEMVIVQFSAYPGHSDETAALFSHAFEAIANHLI
ncbi:hypothetical protein ACINKY_18330 [Paenibacillus illinoisensis]|uniref:Uncharacterized protein n=1 Tax=Paenibacillus illinoisensis TaxID=59845 RepID=A0ABW8HY47_9BACL